jgi:GNAT superfamily N-acetyltransferase
MTTRPLAEVDAASAAELSTELGYPVSAEVMAKRLRTMAADVNHIALAACLAGRVVAWIDVGIVSHLQSGRFGEIGGFVVAAEYRSAGIGTRLLAAAEEWIASRGVSSVVVRSRITRERAHSFYLRAGYTQTKISAVFTKTIPT